MRSGGDARIEPDRETSASQHTLVNVYAELLLDVCRWYPGLPDPRTLTLTEIRFFFEGIRPTLWSATKPRKK